MSPTKISLYNGVKDTGKHPDKRKEEIATEVLMDIRDGKYRAPIEALRKLLLHHLADEFDTAKAKLPAVTWSGIFNERKKTDIYRHSGLICFDLDHLEQTEIETLKTAFVTDPYIFAAFVSPSGKGLKFLIQTDISPEWNEGAAAINDVHGKTFLSFQHYFEATYKLKIDPSGKDCSRLCFLSYDPNLYYDENKTVFGYEECKTWGKVKSKTHEITYDTETKTTTTVSKKWLSDKKKADELEETEAYLSAYSFDSIVKFVESKHTYTEGSRNNYIHLLACEANRKGLSVEDTLGFVASNYPEGDEPGMVTTIKKAFENNAAEHGKHQHSNGQTFKRQTTGTAAPASSSPKSNSEYNDTVKFWYTVTTEDKKTGLMKEEIKFDHDKITFFLANNGFRKIQVGDKFQFILIKENKIEPVTDDRITHFIECYLSQNLKENEHGLYVEDDIISDDFYEVRKMFKRGKKTYANEKAYNSLPVFTPRFVRDTEHKAFLYFTNCFVEITKAGIEKKPYTELNGNIWSKQIIPHEFAGFTKAQVDDAEFSRFMELAICGKIEPLPENPSPETKEKFDLVMKKYLSAITGIGYMIHRFKDPANTKVVVTVDKKLRAFDGSNGGSGKTMYFTAIGEIVHTCLINGKSFKFDKPYPFETVNLDHATVVFNDVKKGFDFEELFHYVTEDFSFSKKYIDAITIPFSEAPKFGIATNFSLKGNGSSYDRRQHVIEFSPYFNNEHTPSMEFGHRFFKTWWPAEEYNRFHCFMIHCTKLYLEKGLIPFPLENYGINKLIDVAGEEFVDWMDERFGLTAPEAVFIENTEYNKKEMFKAFQDSFPGDRFYSSMKSNRFTTWVREWAKERGFEIIESKSDKVYGWKFGRKP